MEKAHLCDEKISLDWTINEQVVEKQSSVPKCAIDASAVTEKEQLINKAITSMPCPSARIPAVFNSYLSKLLADEVVRKMIVAWYLKHNSHTDTFTSSVAWNAFECVHQSLMDVADWRALHEVK